MNVLHCASAFVLMVKQSAATDNMLIIFFISITISLTGYPIILFLMPLIKLAISFNWSLVMFTVTGASMLVT